MRRLLLAPVLLPLLAFACEAAPPDYNCRARGVLASQGETLCIPTHAGARRALCGKVLNVSSWTFLDGDCGEPAVTAPSPSNSSEDEEAKPTSG